MTLGKTSLLLVPRIFFTAISNRNYIFYRINDAELWYQQRVQNPSRRRKLQELGAQELVSRALTFILQVAYYGNYTNFEIGNAVVNIIQNNSEDLVISLRGGDLSYFAQVDAIEARAIEETTLAPIGAPLVEKESEEAADSNTGGNVIKHLS